jgi:hypothetical protein
MTATLDDMLVAADTGQVTDGKPADPDPEVPGRARRRTFTAKYKLEVLAVYEAAEPGEKGAIFRREDLYSSHIVEPRPHFTVATTKTDSQTGTEHQGRHVPAHYSSVPPCRAITLAADNNWSS